MRLKWAPLETKIYHTAFRNCLKIHKAYAFLPEEGHNYNLLTLEQE